MTTTTNEPMPIELSVENEKPTIIRAISLSKKDVWDKLSRIDVGEFLQMRGDFPYLPWATAWDIMMENYPSIKFRNHLNEAGYPAFFDAGNRAMVRVTVIVEGIEVTEDYMVTDYRNNAIESPDPSDINDALKRAFVKCCAYFGLGQYLYRGETCPRSTLRQKVNKILEDCNKDEFNKITTWAETERVSDMTDTQLKTILRRKTK